MCEYKRVQPSSGDQAEQSIDCNGQQVERPAKERGAVLLIVAMLTVVLLLSAGFAVDLGAWYTRAEEMQQAADSAALAAAVDFAASGYDEAVARAKVDEILRQNDIEPSDDSFDIDVTFDAATGRVAVEISDSDVDIFFSRLVQADMGLQRGAAAEIDGCGSSCIKELLIAEPLEAGTFAGSGDGWAPILIGDRVFAINHHSDVATGGDIVCVDRETQTACAGYPKNISPLQPAGTDWNLPTAVIGSRIFYHAQRATELVLGCFDTGSDEACGGGHIILDDTLSDPGGDHDYQTRGGGTILASDGMIYVFSSTKTYCVDPGTYATCTGFPIDNGLADAALIAGELSGAQQSSLQIGERIYVTHTWYLEETQQGVRLHCWDISTDLPCVGFGAVQVHPSGDPSTSGRLFAMRTPSAVDNEPGTAYGVCSLQGTAVVCVDLDGIALPDPADFEADWGALAIFKIGTPFLHDRTNRLFVPSRSTNETYCYDFDFQTSCGAVSFGTTGDYGYASEGDCIYGLGHHSVFWTFNPDLSADCRSAVTNGTISSCTCLDGTKHWGAVAFNGDLDSTFGPYETFEVVVRAPAPDNTVFINESILDTDGVIDLSGVPTTFDYLEVDVTVTAKVGEDPWFGGAQPAIEVGWRDRPHLVD